MYLTLPYRLKKCISERVQCVVVPFLKTKKRREIYKGSQAPVEEIYLDRLEDELEELLDLLFPDFRFFLDRDRDRDELELLEELKVNKIKMRQSQNQSL